MQANPARLPVMQRLKKALPFSAGLLWMAAGALNAQTSGGTLQVSSATLTSSGTISAGVSISSGATVSLGNTTQTGSSTSKLSGANTYNGATLVPTSVATLSFGNTTQTGSGANTYNGGTLVNANATTLSAGSVNVTDTLTSNTLTLDGTLTLGNGGVLNGGALSTSGNLNLTFAGGGNVAITSGTITTSTGLTMSSGTVVMHVGGVSLTVFQPNQLMTSYDATSGVSHYLTVQSSPSNGGTASISFQASSLTVGSFSFISQTAHLTATANTGWKFTSWNDSNTQSSRDVVIQDGDVNYTANFIQKTPCKLLAPSNASPLTSTAVTFIWDTGVGVDQYRLYVGSTVGGNDIINQTVPVSTDPAKTTYSLSTILPSNVSTFYVRLWAYIDGVWGYYDYTYTTNFPQTGAAKMLSPSNGSTLTSYTPTFTWDAGIGATQYALIVGSTPGGNDIFNNTVSSLSQKITLPANTQAIYMALYSKVNGVWEYNIYAYTIPAEDTAQMLTPAGGSALTSASATFTWSAGVDVSHYALWIGSSPNTHDIYSKPEATSLTDTVNTLPGDGRTLYVSLYSMINGAWQYNGYTYAAYTTPPPAKAQIQTLASGSTLTSASPTFTWNAGTGVSQYALWIGSAPNTYDLYAAVVTGTSQSVTVPADGRTIYVNLWSMINGVWQNNSYTYTTLDNKAKMTNPAGGSTLPSAITTFNWSAGTGVSQYAIWIGSSPGTYDLYAKAEGTSLSDTVNLPADGRRIFVRIYSMMNGAWKFNGYTYTAFTSGTDPKAALTSPSNGSTLPSGNVTFNWSTGSGVSQYAVWVGSAPDTYDLYAAVVTGTSRTVTLPTDGRPVYVNFWSMINGVWQPNKYLFTAATQGSAPKALVTSPANGSILTSGTLALNWNAGSAATQYALWVGSAPNTYDLYAGVEGTNLSKTLQLPLDGRRLYVTLWSYINGAWQPVSYYYDTTQ